MHDGEVVHSNRLAPMMVQQLYSTSIASRPQPTESVARTTRGACGNCGAPTCGCGLATEADATSEDQPADELSISEEAQAQADSPNVTELSEGEFAQLTELKQRDREVRSHEQAHVAAAGQYARGGPSFEYQVGPDGQRYAIGGEVDIDTSPIANDPAATIQKAQQIRAAALAPADPSSQDRRIAAAATQMEAQARAELSREDETTDPGGAGRPEPSADETTGFGGVGRPAPSVFDELA